MQKKIEELSIIELKALLYDQVVMLEQTNNNIKILQTELQKKLDMEFNEKNIETFQKENK